MEAVAPSAVMHASQPLRASALAMQPVRAVGRVLVDVGMRDGRTVLTDLSERGGYRVKFPAVDAGCEAVMINTGGGMTGGDELVCHFTAGAGVDVTICTQSAEKIYRSSGLNSRIMIAGEVAKGARASWLPQEAILFSCARLSRECHWNIAAGGTLLLAEMTVFGRIASGETMGDGYYRDRWRIHREGRLIFADDFILDGPLDERLAQPGILNGMRSMATILHVGADVEELRDKLRNIMQGRCEAGGASAWNGMLVARAVDRDPAQLKALLVAMLGCLHPHALPRVWQC